MSRVWQLEWAYSNVGKVNVPAARKKGGSETEKLTTMRCASQARLGCSDGGGIVLQSSVVWFVGLRKDPGQEVVADGWETRSSF